MLTGNLAGNWKKFKQRFELYMEAAGASKKDVKTKTSIFLTLIGDECLDIYNGFNWEDEQDSMKLI